MDKVTIPSSITKFEINTNNIAVFLEGRAHSLEIKITPTAPGPVTLIINVGEAPPVLVDAKEPRSAAMQRVSDTSDKPEPRPFLQKILTCLDDYPILDHDHDADRHETPNARDICHRLNMQPRGLRHMMAY
ncbi:hypothetical protein JB92DRAFT_3013218 [Gautieria morchelliformis]|nr:hypothetical protein JB92DRAFT_3013218 [Gautieria morchelliformis]